MKRLLAINDAFDHVESLPMGLGYRAELLRYIPLGLVSCVEGYFRLGIRDLIDSEERFAVNADKLDLRLSISDLTAVQGQKVSIGEFVAHLISFSSLEDLASVMSTILGEDYIRRLKRTKWAKEGEVLEWREEVERARLWVTLTFRARHVYAHELAPKLEPDDETIEKCLRSVMVFIIANEDMFRELLTPSA